MSGAAARDVMEKTEPEGVAVGSRRLYWNRTGGWTGGREGDSVVDSGITGEGDAGVEGLSGGDDTGETGGGGEETETDSSGGDLVNRKDRETDGAGVVVEEGEA